MNVGERLRNLLVLDQEGTNCQDVLYGGMLFCGLRIGVGERVISLHELGRKNPWGAK